MIRLQAEPFDAGAELASFTASAEAAGAIASFLGTVRSENGVSSLELQHYPGLTEGCLAKIAENARARFDLVSFLVIHRHGTMAPGEPIVFVAAAAAHRRAAFDAVDFMMDLLKTEAAFWKREHGAQGPRWIEARASDLLDAARWP